MDYYFTFEENTGQITGCYPKKLKNIPTPNILVSEAIYKKFHENQLKFEIRDGQFVERIITEAEKIKNLKNDCLIELRRLADHYHNEISQASPQKLARYEAKAKAAAAFVAGIATDIDLALLQPEAEARGLTLEQHVDAILAANAAFTTAAGVIEAVEAKGKAAINAATTIEELEAIRAKIPTEAQTAFAAWQQSLA